MATNCKSTDICNLNTNEIIYKYSFTTPSALRRRRRCRRLRLFGIAMRGYAVVDRCVYGCRGGGGGWLDASHRNNTGVLPTFSIYVLPLEGMSGEVEEKKNMADLYTRNFDRQTRTHLSRARTAVKYIKRAVA